MVPSSFILHPLTFACAASPPSQATSALPSRIDPKAQEILDRTLQALGGPAFLRFRTLTTRGRAFSIDDGATAGFVTFESEIEYPDKRRFAYGMGKKKPVVLFNNGDQAWENDPMGLTHQLPEQIERWRVTNRYSVENLLRLRIREPGVLIQDAGTDFVENLATRVIEIVTASHDEVKLYVNQKDFLPVRIAYTVRNPKTGEKQEYIDSYADYQNIQGIQTPMHITRYLDDERQAETFRNFARYDETYAANYFQPPPE